MMIGMQQAPSMGSENDTVIKDGTSASFMADVVEASADRPVIVDFWAPWCGPCKQMAPTLEKVVMEQGGKVRLVKINVDENQQLAAGMRVQSVPSVYVFYKGRPVEGFAGAQAESQLRAFVSEMAKLAGDGPEGANIASMLAQAEQFLGGGKHDHAQALYSEILELDAAQPQAYAGLVRAFLAAGMKEESDAMYADAPDAVKQDKAWVAVETAFAMQKKADEAGPLDALCARVTADPRDHQARCELALAQFAAGQREEAVDNLLHIIQHDRKWNDEQARKELVSMFEVMGHTDALTVSARRRLSSILFS